MASLKRAAKNSFESIVANGDDSARLREIRSVGKAPQRAALLAVHATVNRFPRLTACALGMKYPTDLARVGAGAQSEVFRQTGSDEVLKIVFEHDGHYNPVELSRKERRRLASELQDQHETMASYLGDMVKPHSFEVGAHPFYEDREAIRITQPYCEIEFIELSDYEDTTGPLRRRIEAVAQTNPGFIPDLETFAASSGAMAVERDLISDILGDDNAGIDTATGQFTIIDSQPVPPRRPDEQQLALHHLNRLNEVLFNLPVTA